MPIEPYGGKLIDRTVGDAEAKALRERAAGLPRIAISSHTLSDLYLLGVGGYSPLEGFMDSADYESVIESMTLSNGLPWSVPVTLPVSDEEAASVQDGGEAALIAEDGGNPTALAKSFAPFHESASPHRPATFARVAMHPTDQAKDALVLLPPDAPYALAKEYADKGAAVIAVDGETPEWPSYSRWRDGFPDQDPLLPSGWEDVVLQLYTSGTTGHPKGVMRSSAGDFRRLYQRLRKR